MTGPFEIALTQLFNSCHGAPQPIMSLLDLISMRCMQIPSHSFAVTTAPYAKQDVRMLFHKERSLTISSLHYYYTFLCRSNLTGTIADSFMKGSLVIVMIKGRKYSGEATYDEACALAVCSSCFCCIGVITSVKSQLFYELL